MVVTQRELIADDKIEVEECELGLLRLIYANTQE
jgi:hypothetical protein